MNTLFIKRLLFCWLLVLGGSFWALAQPAFPPTADVSCNNCTPDGYTELQANYTPAISKPQYYGLNLGTWTLYNGQGVASPPSNYAQKLGDTHESFVSLRSINNAQGNLQEAIQTTVTGFKPNKAYTITYNVLSSALSATQFGKSAKLKIATTGQVQIGEQETMFGLSRNVWITKFFTFIAPSETLVFTLEAGQMDLGQAGFVNFDIDNFPFTCSAGTGDVPVSQSEVNIVCPNTTFDLTTLVSNPPAGIENVWYTDAGHADGSKVANPSAVPPGTYYLFRYDPDYECFNVQFSNAQVKVKDLGRIDLKTTEISNVCPSNSVNLINQIDGALPSGHTVRWYTTKDRSTPPVPFANSVTTSGTYYPFILNLSANCFYKSIAEDSIKVTINAPCCQAGTEQVKLITGNKSIDCGETANLNALLANTNNFPSGTVVEWYTTPNHAAGTKVNTPGVVIVGTYYAFVFDPAANCYNTNSSTAKVTVTGINGYQVALDATVLNNECPSKTVSLYTAYNGNPPAGFSVVFYSTPNHAPGSIVISTVNVTGKYYAFYFNSTTGCFNTDNSTAEVQVVIVDCTPCPATGSEQVDLKTNSKSNLCPSETVNLYSTLQIGAVPAGTEAVWYDNPYHWGAKLTVAEASAVSVTDRFYVFLHDLNTDCYNTGVSTSFVDVTINAPCPPICDAGTQQVALKTGPATNTCPAGAANLNAYLENLLPPSGLQYRWFTNATHTGTPIQNPGNVLVDGTFYAFIYDAAHDCYNTDNSTAALTVILQECKVSTNIKVKLQGAIPAGSADMHNNLHLAGLLPTVDPYGLGGDGPTALVDNIVDWIKVEIRSAATPGTVLESKSFMLKTDGSLEQYDGVTTILPYFRPQFEPVHIVVRHRNHVAIMSKVIDDFTVGSIDLDFTTGLQQCYNDGSAPAQMIFLNGVWCMSAGDLNGDETVNEADNGIMTNAFHQGLMDQYIPQDLNMDGVVDDVDVSIFNRSYYNGLFSIITKY